MLYTQKKRECVYANANTVGGVCVCVVSLCVCVLSLCVCDVSVGMCMGI